MIKFVRSELPDSFRSRPPHHRESGHLEEDERNMRVVELSPPMAFHAKLSCSWPGSGSTCRDMGVHVKPSAHDAELVR